MKEDVALMKSALLLVSCLAVASAFGQSSLASDPAYQKQCAKCHGNDANGRHPFGGPSLHTTQLSVDEVKAVIENGRNKMPAFKSKLSDEQIAALAAEIKNLSKK